MRYFQLRDDIAIIGRWHVGQVLSDDGTEPQLRAGIFSGQKALRSSVTHPGKVLDFCLTSFAVPIGTKRVADIIGATAGSDLESIPVDISGAEEMVVLNATRLVDCLYENQSEFVKWTVHDHRPELAGQYRQVTKLVIDPEAVPEDAHFFRLKGWSVALVVSEAVQSALTRSGCVGAKFVPI